MLNRFFSATPKQKRATLLWLPHDWRVHDNAALELAAALNQPLLCVASITAPRHPAQPYRLAPYGQAKTRFIRNSLATFDQALQQLGNGLIISGKPSLDIPKLVRRHHITDIVTPHSADYDLHRAQLDIAEKLPQLKWHRVHTHSLFDEDNLPFSIQEMPQHFTPFREAIEAHGRPARAETDSITSLPAPPVTITTTEALEDIPPFCGGEKAGLTHLRQYLNGNAPSEYKHTRNALEGWSTSSKCSPWLANGSLSARFMLDAIHRYESIHGANESTYWLYLELLWREFFYWQARRIGKSLYHRRGAQQQRTSAAHYPTRIQQWQHATTPYPLVNAIMNELKATGYISNRARQIAASAFIHELGVDWRYGASYFESQLIDYDPASNWGNWQYIAGVGADPRGGRHFNLEKQQEQYDPNGEYIERWQGNKQCISIHQVDAADWPV